VSRPSGQRSFWLTFHRPPWQEQLPRHLRFAAEWQFGTLPLAALVMLFRGVFAATAALVIASVFCFTYLAAWREDRRINSPYLWWSFVILVTALGLLILVGSIFTDDVS
jgi:hypothetical protein